MSAITFDADERSARSVTVAITPTSDTVNTAPPVAIAVLARSVPSATPAAAISG